MSGNGKNGIASPDDGQLLPSSESGKERKSSDGVDHGDEGSGQRRVTVLKATEEPSDEAIASIVTQVSASGTSSRAEGYIPQNVYKGSLEVGGRTESDKIGWKERVRYVVVVSRQSMKNP